MDIFKNSEKVEKSEKPSQEGPGDNAGSPEKATEVENQKIYDCAISAFIVEGNGIISAFESYTDHVKHFFTTSQPWATEHKGVTSRQVDEPDSDRKWSKKFMKMSNDKAMYQQFCAKVAVAAAETSTKANDEANDG